MSTENDRAWDEARREWVAVRPGESSEEAIQRYRSKIGWNPSGADPSADAPIEYSGSMFEDPAYTGRYPAPDVPAVPSNPYAVALWIMTFVLFAAGVVSVLALLYQSISESVDPTALAIAGVFSNIGFAGGFASLIGALVISGVRWVSQNSRAND